MSASLISVTTSFGVQIKFVPPPQKKKSIPINHTINNCIPCHLSRKFSVCLSAYFTHNHLFVSPKVPHVWKWKDRKKKCSTLKCHKFNHIQGNLIPEQSWSESPRLSASTGLCFWTFDFLQDFFLWVVILFHIFQHFTYDSDQSLHTNL